MGPSCAPFAAVAWNSSSDSGSKDPILTGVRASILLYLCVVTDLCTDPSTDNILALTR
jgi:hypothetical protein